MDLKTVNNNFTYHKPEGDDQLKYENLRAKARELALLILDMCPASREQSLAFTNLEQSVMWANASIARDGKAPEVSYPQPEEVTPAHGYTEKGTRDDVSVESFVGSYKQ